MNFLPFKIPTLALILLMLGPVSLFAQEITIQGKVVDKESGEALPGATVMAPEQMRGGYADDEGKFSFTVPRAESILIRATLLEYDTVEVTVTPEAGKSTYDVTLKMSSGDVNLEAVVITAGRHEQKLAEVTTSMEVIKPAAVDVQATSNIEDVLQQAPGVDIIDGQPNIRGSSGFAYGVGSRVLLMLDGLPLSSADASTALFDVIPVDNLAQVEIMKGASSVLYGSSALGGVINVITADAPREPMTSVRVRGAIYDTPPVKANDWDGNKNAYIGSAHIFHSRRINNHDFTALVDLIKDSGFRQRTDKEQARVMFMTKFRPKNISGLVFGANAAFRVDSSNNYLYWHSYMPGEVVGLLSGDTAISGGALTGDPSTLRSQVNYRINFDPFVKYLTPKGNVHTYRGRLLRTANTNDTQQSNFGTMFYNDYQYTTKVLKDRISWVSGLTVTGNWARGDSLYGESGVDPNTGDTVLIGGAYTSQNLAVYSQMDMKIGSRLNASFGARYDLWFINGGEQYGNKLEQSPVFRVGMNYNTFPGNNIRFNIGQAFRSPSIAERFTSTTGGGLIIAPNPNLNPEKGLSAEIGMRQGFRFGTNKRGAIGFVDAAAFVMDYDQMIEFGVDTVLFDPQTFSIQPIFASRNVANARIPGVEITALVNFTWDKFRLDATGGVTYIEPRNLNPAPADQQVDMLNTPDDSLITELFALLDGSKQDNPEFLKYRNKLMGRASITIGYDKFNLTTNIQTKDNIPYIDQYLYVAVNGAKEYVQKNGLGYTLVNMVAAYDFTPNFKLSFHVNNLFNTEWVVLPGIVGEQRRFTVQAKYIFR